MKGFELVKGWARELVDIMLLFVAIGVDNAASGFASPWKSLSTPAMMRSRVDFPAPFEPSTPILAPG